MTATSYVRADKDELVIDVTGADPASTQTASVDLQSGRHTGAAANGAIGTLSRDVGRQRDYSGGNPSFGGGSGQTFGSLAALTAGARNVAASATDGGTDQSQFTRTRTGPSGSWSARRTGSAATRRRRPPASSAATRGAATRRPRRT